MTYISSNTPTGQEPTDLTETERHRLLAAQRRRIVITVLSNAVTPISLEDLALKVAKQEDDVEASDAVAVDRLKESLHHRHLPMMDDLSVLEYDVTETEVPAFDKTLYY